MPCVLWPSFMEARTMRNLILAALMILPACTCTTIEATPSYYEQWIEEINCPAEQEDQLTCSEVPA